MSSGKREGAAWWVNLDLWRELQKLVYYAQAWSLLKRAWYGCRHHHRKRVRCVYSWVLCLLASCKSIPNCFSIARRVPFGKSREPKSGIVVVLCVSGWYQNLCEPRVLRFDCIYPNFRSTFTMSLYFTVHLDPGCSCGKLLSYFHWHDSPNKVLKSVFGFLRRDIS